MHLISLYGVVIQLIHPADPTDPIPLLLLLLLLVIIHINNYLYFTRIFYWYVCILYIHTLYIIISK
jgi:hypothetical protein